jgi:hypothetical protein
MSMGDAAARYRVRQRSSICIEEIEMKSTIAAGASGVALALALAGPALAGPYSTPEIAHPTFSQLDVDGSGKLSKGEAAGTSGLLSEWDRADRNADNRIDRAEFSAFEPMAPAATYGSIGTAHGGMSGSPPVRFEVLDPEQRGEFLYSPY